MKSQPLVLVIDDEAAVRFGIRDFLESSGFRVEEAGTCRAARELGLAIAPDLVVADYSLPDGTVLDLLPQLRAADPGLPVVVLTGFGSIELAVQAMQAGAEHFLTKPVELPALLLILRRLLESRRHRRREAARASSTARQRLDPFLGSSAAIARLRDEALRAVDSEGPILLQGETGSGKGVLAAWLHENGPREREAFVDLNCAGLSREFLESEVFGHERGAFTGAVAAKPGLLEMAHRGTLFLDEIGDLDLQVQPKLLKVIEEKRYRRLGEVRDRAVEVTLFAATHQNLEARVAEGAFRADLFYRISAVPLRVPPLRERREDVVPVARRLLEIAAPRFPGKRLALEVEAEAALAEHDWPGNVRELRNVLERGALLTETGRIGGTELRFDRPGRSGSSSPIPGATGDEAPPLDATWRDVERWHLARVLAAEGGHVERAARTLAVPRSTLYQRLRALGLR